MSKIIERRSARSIRCCGCVWGLLAVVLLFAGGCQNFPQQVGTFTAGVHATSVAPPRSFSRHDSWQVQPLANLSVTDAAAESVDVILATHLRKRGMRMEPGELQDVDFMLEGKVSRWHYAGGASARPVAQVYLDVRNMRTGEVVWSDTASDTGHRGQSLSSLADRLIQTLVVRLPLADGAPPDGAVPDGAVPDGAVPDGAVPDGAVPDEAVSKSDADPQVAPLPIGMIVDTTAGRRNPASRRDLIAGLALKSESASRSETSVATGNPLAGRSVAFYYAANPPVDILSQYDRLVLEPDSINRSELGELTARGARAYAYLSVGEVGPSRAYARDLEPSWILGKNPAWGSSVLDLSNSALRDFLLERAGQLHADGYGGLFLDTMDSFNLIARTDAERGKQQAGLVSLVAQLAKRYPAMKIITNRGFEVLDEIAGHVEAVAAESLYSGWDNATQQYSDVPAGDRQWLLSKLDHAHDNLNLDVIVIDYLPPSQRDRARTVATQIAEHGFIPWVTNPALDYIGIGALEVLPRKVLMIYDSTRGVPLAESPVHKFVATPIEYMGYVPEYLDVGKEAWPDGELKGRYAGIVTWTARQYKDSAVRPWLQKQLDDKVPLALMVMPPVPLDKAMTRALGISQLPEMDLDSAQLVHADDFIAPERSLSQRIDSMGLMTQSVDASNRVHMTYEDKAGKRADVVVTGDFGGFAWQPGLVEDGLNYETYWVIDPFKFLRTALQLPDAPMPDVTTENGKRLWMAHIDGDALPSWAEMPGRQLGAEIIYDQILTRYPLPHTVSVVESEMTEFDAYDDRRQKMFDIARKTFRLEHVELASHTYSHPFKWVDLGKYRKSGKYNLPVAGYEYSSERDIGGSIDFVNRELAPPGKRLKVMLWSGDALPQADDLAVLDKRGLPNLNGGRTFVTNATNTLTLVSPMARPVGDYLQVYAPIMNENMYTNDWLGPFDGFKHAIETFSLTESPRRLKPINVYYHFYSGTKIAAMKALTSVYDWSISQEIHPIHISDYSRKVPHYRQAGVARYLDGRWKISGLGDVHSLRILGTDQWPEFAGSTGLTGARKLHDGVYVHTDGANEVSFFMTSRPPAGVHLVSSNGRVLRWDDSGDRLVLRVSAEVPASIELGGGISRSCALRVGNKSIRGQVTRNKTIVYSFTTRDTGDAILNCPA